MVKKILYALAFPAILFLGPMAFSQQTIGLFYNTSESYNGYTLFAPGAHTSTFLIDNCGKLIHQWDSDFRPGLSAYLLSNGNLLRTATDFGSSPLLSGGTGGRIELFNWESERLWSWPFRNGVYHQHHDIEPLPNGNVLILAWEEKPDTFALSLGRDTQLLFVNALWAEYIVEVRPIFPDSAEIVWEWRTWDHVIQDLDDSKPNFGQIKDHPERININFLGASSPGTKDWTHANSIDYNPTLDQVMIGSRTFSEVWIIDHSTSTQEAAGGMGGNSGKGGDLLYRWGNPTAYDRGTSADQKFFGQHDARWIEPDRPGYGGITVFNNGADRPFNNTSTIDMIIPEFEADGSYKLHTDSTFLPIMYDWSFESTGTTVYSGIMSGAERLPNGNTLICSADQSLFLEVDNEGREVWKYICPVGFNIILEQGQNPFSGPFRATRYPPEYPAFENRDLSPGLPIELNPLPTSCEITTGIVQNAAPVKHGFVVSPNPVKNQMTIAVLNDLDVAEIRQISLTSLTGIDVYKWNDARFETRIDLPDIADGLYLVVAELQDGRTFVEKVIVKRK